METPSGPPQRKRVHFSYSDDSDEGPRVKKARFPKGKKEAPGDPSARNLGVVEGEEAEGAVLSTDPRVAALERAIKRDRVTEQVIAEDTSVANDVGLAEEDYEDEDEERVEDGMRIEPFNLKQEREEGYFDAEGNYVEYRNDDDIKDAWFDSVEVNTRFAAKAAAQAAHDAADADELSKEETAGIKRRIADALQPGETVLRALRRLKGANNNERMSGDTKVQFDQLTEDAMKLLDGGDYNVYEEKKETFQREAEGYEALARLRSGASNGGSSSGGGSYADHSDMFADLPDNVVKIAASSTNGSSSALGDGLAAERGNGSSLNMLEESVVDPKAVDIFSEDNSTVSERTPAPSTQPEAQTMPAGTAPFEGSGYVFDQTSGYYYNSELGYFYDATTGLYCSAGSSEWYKFNEEKNTYEQLTQ